MEQTQKGKGLGMKRRGATEKFDPADGFWAEDPAIYKGLIQKDAYGDYDGDGVLNAVELFIGKNPVKPDVLGIKLTVAVGWNADEDYLKKLIKGFQRASQVIYDYTDGYTMITRVNIWDNKRNWERADVRVYNAEWELPVVNKDQWPASIVGGYWMSSGYIQMPKRFFRISTNSKGEIGDDKWGRTLGHELGHYVFWLGDEYKDWHDHGYKTWYVLIASSYDKYRILNDRLLSIHSVMNNEWKWSELSTPQEYAEFKSDAIYFMEQYSGNIFLLGYTSWEDVLPAQWGNVTKNPQTDYPIWHCSAWRAVYSFLSGHNTPLWITNTFKPENHPRHQRVLISIPSVGDNFIPKTGPYTGVGYFMEGIWR